MDEEGKRFENHYLFDDKLVHLVDEIFWLMGFKSAEHADKVISQIIDYFDYCNYCAYLHYFRSALRTTSLRAHGTANVQTLLKR